jgi:hypothetical protein
LGGRVYIANMKTVVPILIGLAIVAKIWLIYHFIYSPWAKHQSKLADAKYRQIMEDVKQYCQAEEAAAKTAMEAIERQKLRQEAEIAAMFRSLQERRTAVDAELEKLIESVSDPKTKDQLRRELDSILAPALKMRADLD